MTRRELLSLMSLFGANALVQTMPGLQLFAQAQTGLPLNNFVLVRMTGGWDVVMGLDPFTGLPAGVDENDLHIGYTENDIIRSGSVLFGPTLAPMSRYLSRCLVVRGIHLSDNNVDHDANLNLMSCGIVDSLTGTVAVELANSMPKGQFPLLISLNGQQIRTGNKSINPETTDNLVRLARESKPSGALPFLHDLGKETHLFGGQRRIQNGQSAYVRFNALRAELTNKLQLDTSAQNSQDFQNSPNSKELPAILAAAFATGLAAQAQVDIRPDLDTHTDHVRRQSAGQSKGWEDFARILQAFESVEVGSGSTLLDHTTFMVVSDFSREPQLNGSLGKDHNALTNSALLIGPHIRGGQAIGQSRMISRRRSMFKRPQHTSWAYNFDTNRVARNDNEVRSSDFQLITPDVVIATVVQAMGVGQSEFKGFSLNDIPVLRTALR